MTLREPRYNWIGRQAMRFLVCSAVSVCICFGLAFAPWYLVGTHYLSTPWNVIKDTADGRVLVQTSILIDVAFVDRTICIDRDVQDDSHNITDLTSSFVQKRSGDLEAIPFASHLNWKNATYAFEWSTGFPMRWLFCTNGIGSGKSVNSFGTFAGKQFVLPTDIDCWKLVGSVLSVSIIMNATTGVWHVLMRNLRRARWECPECKYDLRGMQKKCCPECGTVLSEMSLPKTPSDANRKGRGREF